jgi:hypothetical protein
MFLIAEDYPLLKINQRIPVHLKILYSGQKQGDRVCRNVAENRIPDLAQPLSFRVFVAEKEEKLWTITLVQRRGY